MFFYHRYVFVRNGRPYLTVVGETKRNKTKQTNKCMPVTKGRTVVLDLLKIPLGFQSWPCYKPCFAKSVLNETKLTNG